MAIQCLKYDQGNQGTEYLILPNFNPIQKTDNSVIGKLLTIFGAT